MTRRGEFTQYNEVIKSNRKDYPVWENAKPNLETYITALNLSQPIVASQFELVYSRWPRTIFFAKNINVPGITLNTLDINHAGFTIPIPTHVKYESNEITMTIIADKEGFHYYDWRNMILQSGHPLIAGDPRSMIGKDENDTNEDYLDVRLRNKQSDRTHHHWIIHNYRPITIGEVELSHDSESMVEFEITGIFTHVTYATGDIQPPVIANKDSLDDKQEIPFGQLHGKEDDQKKDDQKKDDNPPAEEQDNVVITPDPSGPTNPEYQEQYKKMENGEGNEFISNKYVDITSEDGSSSLYATTENYIGLQNSDDGTPPSKEERDMAKKYQEQLNAQNAEVEKRLQEISQMEPDKNFKPEKVEKEFNIKGDLAREGQTKDPDDPEKTDRYAGTIVYGGTFSSQAQKDAFEKLMNEHKDKTLAINRAYKEEKANLGKKQ